MVRTLALVLGDQLSKSISSLRHQDRAQCKVLMAEVLEEATYVPHHPKKIALVFSAMRHFAEDLREDGWDVHYTKLDDPTNTGSLIGELDRHAQRFQADCLRVTEPGEWRLRRQFSDHPGLEMVPDDRFVSNAQEFASWADGRKQLRLEYFYRDMRRKTGLLVEPDGQPVGGKWNYDAENRKPAKPDLFMPQPIQFENDAITKEVLDLVESQFPDHYGTLRPFDFAVTADQAQAAADYFISDLLPNFGDYQDAMLAGERTLYHSVLSPYLNLGLLDPLKLCRQAEKAYFDGSAPLNAVEGFIRQIIGWREFVRGIYFELGEDYVQSNALDANRNLPEFYWTAQTSMACVSDAVKGTMDTSYAHHIQRLMVTGNFALIAGIDPHQVHEWYLAVYADAYEWVEAPNTIGMSLFADGGVLGSKPYASSGAYINRMSNYCGSCAYNVKDRSGENACPFNALYWDFLIRNRGKFAKNPRMTRAYYSWDRMEDQARAATISRAKSLLQRLDEQEPI